MTLTNSHLVATHWKRTLTRLQVQKMLNSLSLVASIFVTTPPPHWSSVPELECSEAENARYPPSKYQRSTET